MPGWGPRRRVARATKAASLRTARPPAHARPHRRPPATPREQAAGRRRTSPTPRLPAPGALKAAATLTVAGSRTARAAVAASAAAVPPRRCPGCRWRRCRSAAAPRPAARRLRSSDLQRASRQVRCPRRRVRRPCSRPVGSTADPRRPAPAPAPGAHPPAQRGETIKS